MVFGTTFGIKPSTFSDVAILTGHWNEETSEYFEFDKYCGNVFAHEIRITRN